MMAGMRRRSGSVRSRIITIFGTAAVWTNMPAALTELFGVTALRTLVNLSQYREVRLVASISVAGAVNSELRVQYTTDGVTWNYLDGGTSPSIRIGTTGVKSSSWAPIVPGARRDVYLRVVGVSGNLIADPNIGNVNVQVR